MEKRLVLLFYRILKGEIGFSDLNNRDIDLFQDGLEEMISYHGPKTARELLAEFCEIIELMNQTTGGILHLLRHLGSHSSKTHPDYKIFRSILSTIFRFVMEIFYDLKDSEYLAEWIRNEGNYEIAEFPDKFIISLDLPVELDNNIRVSVLESTHPELKDKSFVRIFPNDRLEQYCVEIRLDYPHIQTCNITCLNNVAKIELIKDP